ncbi:unnamed protein product [Aureobasidium uvarum]|uniref:Ribosomal RNA methyltransferase FtsJ domain-containing protein n=1 Tax=Aureobasidium uvarum TaxID=2773716 RepID=A0A9N8K995_9PEZI|nr:unnamed protein product [Aureobasidium uvarum]
MSPGPLATTGPADLGPRRSQDLLSREFREYLSSDPDYRRLDELQQKGWNNPEGDQYFNARRQKSASADRGGGKYALLRMMKNIGDQFNTKTGAFEISSAQPKVLDFCMAPGGFVSCALKYNESAKVDAFSLHPNQGGHRVLVDYGIKDERVTMVYKDVTMFAAEFGVPSSPEHHSRWKHLQQKWPYHTPHYDLVICDGAILPSSGYQDSFMIEINSMMTFRLINLFHEFSSVRLFKPPRAHAIKSSFYLLARNVQSDSQPCLEAMTLFKHIWEQTTFETISEATYRLCNEFSVERRPLSPELEEFGSRYIELARPLWNVQADALAAASFTKVTAAAPS